jgi:ElaB/YqjD/DUF883 family membrane-anchored ribosome-binding protein
MSGLMPQKDDDPRQLSRPATRSRSSEHQGKTMNMNTNPTSGQMSRSTPGHVEPEHVAPDGLSAEMSNLRRDVASLKDTFARLASQAGGEVAKTVRGMSQTVASQVGSTTSGVTDAGSEIASAAKEHAKTLVSELEVMARRNPLGTIAGALLVGVIIGMMSRGRG